MCVDFLRTVYQHQPSFRNKTSFTGVAESSLTLQRFSLQCILIVKEVRNFIKGVCMAQCIFCFGQIMNEIIFTSTTFRIFKCQESPVYLTMLKFHENIFVSKRALSPLQTVSIYHSTITIGSITSFLNQSENSHEFHRWISKNV